MEEDGRKKKSAKKVKKKVKNKFVWKVSGMLWGA